MMKQYQKIKKQYNDCFLFFRLGDFYELFCEDAEKGAPILNIALTKRPRGKDGDIPMAGVPFHSADIYISKLIKAGYKVAICEQITEPDNKGIVERAVVRVVSAGTILDENSLDKKEHNFIMSISRGLKNVGIAIVDLSTGDFQVTEIEVKNNFENIISTEISRFNPQECILNQEMYEDEEFLRIFKAYKNINIYCFEDWDEYARESYDFIKEHFQVSTLISFDLEDKQEAQKSASVLLAYLKETQKDNVKHIKIICSYTQDDFVLLDRSTLINLEIFSTIKDNEKKGSLLDVIDYTTTALGGRMLKTFLQKPLKQEKKINERLDAVEYLARDVVFRNDLKEELKKIYDIPRIISRLSVGLGNAYDLIKLKLSFLAICEIKKNLEKTEIFLLQNLKKNIIKDIEEKKELIEKYIEDNPANDLKSGGLIKKGINEDLDKLKEEVGGGKSWLVKMENEEKKKTGINNLRIKYNRVFGYFIEISKSNLKSVPENYFRSQTMTNGERFFTKELKEYEEKILAGEEAINKLEFEIFSQVLDQVLSSITIFQKVSESIAILDCLLSLAELADKKNYVKPKLSKEGIIDIKSGRHPVVEDFIFQKQFVPNDCLLNHSKNQMLIITGPNMAGKSVFMRQVALIVLLAHIGSFVPAESAIISLVDRIFVRSGASDFISSGLSTFMVEMVETAHILNHASKDSLIIMDEIGRGTSTYDGISIAWAVAEYLVCNKKISSKTLFATHYHELQLLEEKYPEKISNYNIAVEDKKGFDPVFLHRVVRGRASHSYAVVVARLAGLPAEVTDKAEIILKKQEQKSKNDFQFDFFNKDYQYVEQGVSYLNDKNYLLDDKYEKIIEEIKKIDLDKTTPIEALNKLEQLKRKIDNLFYV